MSSPTLANASISQWRQTPPPMSSVIRPNKRKSTSPPLSSLPHPLTLPAVTDSDRFDPYERTKRRAVSPSVHHLRTPSRAGIALAIPASPMRGLASPTLRALASPVLRPLRAARRDEESEREVTGAGSAVSGLTLT
jgi:hypothetical protein